ncbi:MAG: zinc-binding alcohol dehydrogenase family protein [Marinomonas sp.]|uniref:zinc-binding alcohol dehydrogenase family protein n=1 Tax=unclassified Marinomonas TaxID=196814 RepID=UPI0007AFDD68|nr:MULTISPECIES: zinc-binding alcohol dehydrogenase family protein [unclassified Marinomonas]KZM40471.1 NADPH:quinone reductase [Marinomonas sp. SBI8L]KZM43562.1 NADPH:quinone reductase [Marinomonas sp. SBI22]
MKAIGYKASLPISDANSLVDIEVAQPKATGHDLLVKIDAIAVNPVDCKIRQNVAPEGDEHKIIGWDAVGEVVATGEATSLFKPGDKVFYAGDLTRSGSNSEFQLVDERIVGHKPKSLNNAEAAALPLTAITAYELLFDRLAIKTQAPGTNTVSDEVILVVGAAGGVGSILIQLAKAISGATIIGTASRESSKAWVKELGADYVIDHTKDLADQINNLEIGPVTHVASLNSTDSYFETYTEILKPFGKIALIDDPAILDVSKMKRKSLSLHWEFMYTHSMFQTEDMNKQNLLLNKVADLVDQGFIKTTVNKQLSPINAANLRAAHEAIESGQSIGKIVLEGF